MAVAASGNREQIQEVLDGGVVPVLLEVLKSADFDTKREAAWAISNAVSGGTDAQVDSYTPRIYLDFIRIY